MVATLTRIQTTAHLAEALGVSERDVRRLAEGDPPASVASRLNSRWQSVFGGSRSSSRFGQRRPQSLLDAVSLLQDIPDNLRSRVSGRAMVEALAETETRRVGQGGTSGGFSSRPPVNPAASPAGAPGSRGIGRNYKPFAPSMDRPAGDTDEGNFSDEFAAPHSSNVFSFRYFRRPRMATGILFVTFRAHHVNPEGISQGRVKRGKSRSRTQLIGQRGNTVGGKLAGRSVGKTKLGEAGAVYAYYDVPPQVFNSMKVATSKGKFVWDTLRVRGTVYGHQYRYSLVTGQLVLGQDGGLGGVYIPRKATRAGFQTRSLADNTGGGTGRRGFMTSTLPEQQFSQRSNGGRRR